MRTKRLPKTCLLLAAAVVLFTFQICAAEAVRYTGRKWALLDTRKVLQAAAHITATRFPNCDEVTVDEKILEVYHADGTAESQDETFTKVLTEKGRRENAVVSLSFLLPYFTVQVAHLEVIKPDGRVIPVNISANSKESIDNSQMEENIYDPNSRILQVNIPGLKIGDMLHTVTRNTVERPIIPNEFSDEFMFEGQGYIRHISCEIRGPAGLPLRHVELRDKVGATVTASTRRGQDGMRVYHWEVKGVPRVYDEPAMPSYGMVLQRLLVSTLPDWSAVSKWYWKLSQPHLDAISPAMQQTATALTAGAKTDLEKIKAVFYYVSKNIRYMGVTPEKNRPGFEPHDVRLTFAKKYGVCRDKAALLVAMLRMAGLKAYPVLISVDRRLDPDVPDPYFNHAIASVETASGRYLLMDPTDEHTRVLLPAYDDNQSYLICGPEGSDLELSLVTAARKNMMQIRTTGVLHADGTLSATSDLSFGGVNDDAYRGAFAEMRPDERSRFFESRLQQALPGVRLTALRIRPKQMLDESVSLEVEINYQVPAMAAFGEKRAIVSLPWIGHRFGVVNSILKNTGLERRRYPLETRMTCGINEGITLKLADNFVGAVSIPSGSSVTNACLSYRRHFRYSGHTLHASKDLRLKVVEFSPGQYQELRRILTEFDCDEHKALVMATIGATPSTQALAPVNGRQRGRITPNATILEDRQELEVKDVHTAVLRVHCVKRILSYAGKIRESEVKIPYDPATQTARIIRAVVISKSGQRQEVSKDEINVMDAAWNSAAKRYTGGKILVDSLPGVEIGSIIDVAYEITMKGQPYLSGFQLFQLPDEIEKKSFEIRAPAGLSVKTLETGLGGIINSQKKMSSGRWVLQWRADKVDPLPEESGLPPSWSYATGVGYYVGDPVSYYKRLDVLMRTHAARDVRARQAVNRLTTHLKTKLEKVEAIRDYVAENVRLAGPTFTKLPLNELSDADRTLADGYGDTADRAILLYAMLTAAGFHPAFVLASDLPAVAELTGRVRSLPFPDEFTAPLVRIELNGNTYYLNDTDQYAHLGSTRHDNRLGIDLTSGARITIRATVDGSNREVTTYSLVLNSKGDARIGIEHAYYGMAFDRKNRRFSELRPMQRSHYFQQMVSHVAQGARPVGGLKTDFKVYPGVEQFEVEVTHYGVADDRCLYFRLPFTPHLFPVKTTQRTLPLLIPKASEKIIRVRIKLPPEYHHVAIGPRSASLSGPDGIGNAHVVSTTKNGQCSIVYHLVLRPAILQPVDYPLALKVESALENKAARMLLVE